MGLLVFKLISPKVNSKMGAYLTLQWKPVNSNLKKQVTLFKESTLCSAIPCVLGAQEKCESPLCQNEFA